MDVNAEISTMVRSIWDMSALDLERCIRLSENPSRAAEMIDFDEWMLMLIVLVARRIGKSIPARKGALGIAQKMVNLTIKDHWALGRVSKQVHGVLHIPLDRRSLSHISNARISSSCWKSRTSVRLTLDGCTDYLKIQKRLRAFFRSSTPFQSTMELDQVWWTTMD
jgi:hypothetical protein